MTPDRGAEIGLQNGLTPEPPTKGSVNLPRWARNPMFAARLTLATLTGLGAVAVDYMTAPIVAAQTVCKGQLTVLGIKFADHPSLGRERIVDPTDFYLGNGDFNVVEVYDAAGKIKFDAWDGKDSAKKPKPIASGNMSDKGTHSIASIAFSGECDEKQQGSAKRVWLTFPSDKNRAIYPEVVGNNRLRVHIAGREERRITELQGVVNNGNFPIKKVGEVIVEITNKLGTPVSFTDPEQLKGDVKTISEANRISLRKQIAKLLKEQEEGKNPVYTEDVRAAIKRDIADQIGEATRDLRQDLQKQAQTTNTSLGNLTTALKEQEKSFEEHTKRIGVLEQKVISLTAQASTAPTSTVPSKGGLFGEIGQLAGEIGRLAGGLPVKEVWPWALGIFAALGSILGYRSWMPATYNIRGKVIPAHLNIRGKRII